MLGAIREGVQSLIGLAQKYAYARARDLESRLRFGDARGRDDCSGKYSPGSQLSMGFDALPGDMLEYQGYC